MKTVSKTLLSLVAGIALLASALPAASQNVTTGTLTGVVMDAQRGVLPGANVVAVHTPTGTTYESVTSADGHYSFINVRVGGPYTVTVNMPGFKKQESTNVTVALGEEKKVDVTLQLETVQETVTVTAETQVIDTSRAGTGANVGTEVLESLPTISRSINDFARTSPFFAISSAAAGNADAITVAGRNNRYNNMQIDGAVNNDVFGLADTGTPGGQTGTQPISLDAIQEIQLVVSPYDVRQGGFSGGGINAVTKSGSNALHGSGFFFGRNQKYLGTIPGVRTPGTQDPGDTKVGAFSDKQMGFSIGGPVVQNRAFFFTNFDWGRRNTPSGFSADGSTGQQFSGGRANVEQVVAIAKAKYGYDAGSLGEFSKPNNSDKIFARTDFNLSPRHQLTARVNYVNAEASIGNQGNFPYKMPSNFYNMTDKMVSSVVQLNSSFGAAFNEFRATYSRERNVRGGQPGDPLFPEVRVDFPDGTYMQLGTEYSSHANKLNQDIVQLSDDVTLVKGQHTFSFGTQNEFYKFYNLFIQNLYGSYRFNSIANFEAGLAQQYSHNFVNPNGNEAANFSVRQFGFYAGDKWRVKSNFTLTYGARLDLPRFPDKPSANPLAVSVFNFSTDAVPAPTMFSPRAGFNWDLSNGSGKRRQVRGGVGLFTGRTPYVWLSNQYGNTGVDFTSLSVSYNANNKVPFVNNPLAQPETVTGGATGRQTLNLIDPEYKYPAVIRTNIGLDHDLGVFGLVGTAEFLYTKNVQEIYYQNLNYTPLSNLPDGRISYQKKNTGLNDVMFLTNSAKGTSWQMAFKVERPFRNGWYASGSYMFGEARSVNDGTSSVARSNWTGAPAGIDVNNPPLTISNYSPGHRVNLAATAPVPLMFGLRSTLSIYYNGQNGRPYSLGFNGDANLDAVTNNDLLYVPTGPDDPRVTVYNGTWDQLMTYLNADPSAAGNGGKILARNTSRAPWQNQMDLRYAINVPTGGKTRAEVTLDIFNFLNLINADWGWQYWADFPGLSRTIGYGGIEAATGKMRYNLSTITASTFQGTFTRDDLKSRWAAQLGARFRF